MKRPQRQHAQRRHECIRLGRPEPLGISQQQWGDVEPESANSTEFRMEYYGTGQSDISHTGAMLMKHYLAVCLSLVMCIAAGVSVRRVPCSESGSGEPKIGPALGLGHEMAHADAPWWAPFVGWIPWPAYTNLEERRVITGPETTAAHTFGEGTRTDHNKGSPYTVPSPTSTNGPVAGHGCGCPH